MMQANAASDEGLDARRLLADVRRVVGRRKGLMLVVFLAAFVGGMAIVATRTLTYRAEATLLVSGPSAPTGLTPAEVPVVADVMAATRSRSVATHIAVMRSPAVLGRALRGLSQKYRAVLDRAGLSVSVETPEGTDIINISVRSGAARAAAALANGVAQQHIRYTRSFNRNLVRSGLSYLQAELAAAREKVDEAERALLAEKRRTGLFSADDQIRSKMTAAVSAEERADGAALEHRAAQMQIAALRGAIAREPAERVSSTREEINPLLQQLRSSVADMKVGRARALVDFAPGSPEMRQIEGQINAAEGLLSGEKRRVTTGQDTTINSVREALRQQVLELQATGEALAARERENRQLQARYMNELDSLNSANRRLLELSSTAELLRENYRLLRERHQSMMMGAEARLPDVSILSPAGVPGGPTGPSKLVQGLFVVFVSALIACCAAWLAEVFGPKPLEMNSAPGT